MVSGIDLCVTVSERLFGDRNGSGMRGVQLHCQQTGEEWEMRQYYMAISPEGIYVRVLSVMSGAWCSVYGGQGVGDVGGWI